MKMPRDDDRIEKLEARIRRLEADLEDLKRLKKENEFLRFNIESLLNYIEEIKKGQVEAR
jgi:hypothetical protein